MQHDGSKGSKLQAVSAQALTRAASALLPRSISVSCRAVSAKDVALLTPAEHLQLSNRVRAALEASASARAAARELLAGRGIPNVDIVRSSFGYPVWPLGIVGSISHDSFFAAAAIADASLVRCLGIDIEPAEPLPEELLELVATPREATAIGGDLVLARVVFSLKEAVYKALNPLTGRFLEFGEVEIDFPTGTAQVVDGPKLAVRHVAEGRIVSCAFLPA